MAIGELTGLQVNSGPFEGAPVNGAFRLARLRAHFDNALTILGTTPHFCRSGKARNGPIHYRPPSREPSHRGVRPPHTPGPSLDCGSRRPVPRPDHRGLTRVSSEPCSIASLAHSSHARGLVQKQDSASSVHEAEVVLSVPMDIYPSNFPHNAQGPTAPVPVRTQKTYKAPSQRRKQRPSTAAAGVAAAAGATAQQDNNDSGTSSRSGKPQKKSCLKQGGLSTALSREPSVRHGTANPTTATTQTSSDRHRCAGDDTNDDEDTSLDVSDGATGSWGARKVTFAQHRNDSARQMSAVGQLSMSDPGVAAAAATEATGVAGASDAVAVRATLHGDAVDAHALASALAALERAVPAVVSTSSGSASPPRTTKAIKFAENNTKEWADAREAAAAGSFDFTGKPRPLQEAAEQASYRPDTFGNTVLALQSVDVASDPLPSVSTTTTAHTHTHATSHRRSRSLPSADDSMNSSNSMAISTSSLSEKARKNRRAGGTSLLEASGGGGGSAGGNGSSEWNARFVKRWKAVKQRARLQALGMRSIWKLNSPTTAGEHHHPPELLTNELPEGGGSVRMMAGGGCHDDSMRLSGILSFSQPNTTSSASASLGRTPATATAINGGAASAAAHRNRPGNSGNNINRDPSLATMLRGEVAEVC